jgi:hypothetical protein
MSSFVNTAGSRHALAEAGLEQKARVLYFPDKRETNESLPVPNRGIVLGAIVSTFLWAALILAARSLWLLLH